MPSGCASWTRPFQCGPIHWTSVSTARSAGRARSSSSRKIGRTAVSCSRSAAAGLIRSCSSQTSLRFGQPSRRSSRACRRNSGWAWRAAARSAPKLNRGGGGGGGGGAAVSSRANARTLSSAMRFKGSPSVLSMLLANAAPGRRPYGPLVTLLPISLGLARVLIRSQVARPRETTVAVLWPNAPHFSHNPPQTHERRGGNAASQLRAALLIAWWTILDLNQ